MKIDDNLRTVLGGSGCFLCDNVEVLSSGLLSMGTVQYKITVDVAPCVRVRLTNTLWMRYTRPAGCDNWELRVTYTHPCDKHRKFAKRVNIAVDDLADWTTWSTKRALIDARAACNGHAMLRDAVYTCADKVRRVRAELIGP